ncbi:transglutaminase-like cysteine peptidase [Rhodopseudomonas pseudopalustris]|uniref:transglutaminase-like cysteine peptidase n=1 Tax=Rhodopseudomonas pseudopalustris TaxID=1513892 RepID=UPI003F98F072
MLRNDLPRVLPRAMGLALALSVIAGPSQAASANANIKKTSESAASDDAMPVTPPQLRFFTINDVLAKHDGLRRSAAAPAEIASTNPAARAGVASDAPPSPAVAPGSDEPFGLMTFRAPEGILWGKWRGVQAAMAGDAASIERCRRDDEHCSPGERKFVAGVRAAAANDNQLARVEIVNRAVNQAVRYVNDYQQHGVADLWSAPLVTLRSGLGDCEDYAIAKYAMLRDVGFAETDLKVLLVRDLAVRQDHAVLAVRVEGRWLVLDNRRATLMEGRDLKSFMPLFALDQRGVSLFAAPYAKRLHHESEDDVRSATFAEAPGGSLAALPLQI